MNNFRTKIVRPRAIISSFLLLIATHASAVTQGERLTRVAGCIGCHHATPKEQVNAPSLLTVRNYSREEFTRLLRTGMTNSRKNLLDAGSLMGIVASEQLAYLTDEEIQIIYEFIVNDWTKERAAAEEAKIPLLYRAEPLHQR